MVISHKAIGYGILVFLIIREGKILEEANILSSTWITTLRVASYFIFLGLYLILYVLKWTSKGNFTNLIIGGGERENLGWRKRIYIPGEKEMLKLEEEEMEKVRIRKITSIENR